MTTKIDEMRKEFIVLENPAWYGEHDHYFVTYRKNFVFMKYSETYNNYGILADVEEGNDFEVEAWTYWNGSNWRSVILGSDMGGYDEVDEETSTAILAELPEYPYIDGVYTTVKTENFDFFFSRMADFNWYCAVA